MTAPKITTTSLREMKRRGRPKEALRHAGRLVEEGGAQAVKLEGGKEVGSAVKELVRVNVPVMGHLGLTPQAVHRLGGYKVQGRRPEDAGRGCDGQILVVDDMLGLGDAPPPSFVKPYAALRAQMLAAVRSYADDARSGAFPNASRSFSSLPGSRPAKTRGC